MPPTPNRRIHEEARLQGRRRRLDGTSSTAISAVKSLTPDSRLNGSYAPRIGERIVMAVNWDGGRVACGDESKTFDESGERAGKSGGPQVDRDFVI